MIVADERAKDGLELFDIDGTESFEMKNETLKMYADEDGTLWNSVRGLTIRDADGNALFTLSWSENGVCGSLYDDELTVEIEEEF
mgnify:CR=1 FL=1